jgi:signal transduction histidine kinase
MGGGPNDGPMKRGPQPPPGQLFGNEQADLIGAIRRPRFIGLDGHLIGGFEGDTLFDVTAVGEAFRGRPQFSITTFRSAPVRVYTMPVKRPITVIDMVVQVARELTDYNEVKRIQTDMLSVFLPLGLVAAVGVAWFLTGRVMRPIKEMEVAAQAIGAGNLSERLKVAGSDEFAQLGTQFNQMADNVQGSITRLETALEQQKRFTADASHELRTPLTRMLLATSSAMEGTEEQRSKAIKTVDDAAKDMTKLVQQLLDLANLEAGTAAKSFVRLDMRLVVSEAVLKTPGDAPEFKVALPDYAVNVKGNADLLERACLNILENARRYSPQDKPIEVSLEIAHGWARMIVKDQGGGIAPEHIPHLTERFYRVDDARTREAGGSGLGLAIVDEIVKLHGGGMLFESEPGKGLTVTIDVPLA